MSSNENKNFPTSSRNYKSYLTDSTAQIPLSTLYRWRSKKKQPVQNNEDNEIIQDPTEMIVDPLEMAADFVEMECNIENSSGNNILNMKSFNSRFGCNICEIETEECAKIKGQKTCRVFQFKSNIKLRTEEIILAQAESLRNTSQEHVKGIKGYSVLSCLPGLDISTCVVPEFMHSVLLGVVKQMIKVWFKKQGNWNISNDKTEIDRCIVSIRPPHTFNRLPRPLSQYKFYKAAEFYNFMLFYSLPVLIGYLPTEYFQHWILLVVAIFNLLKTNITQTDLNQSDELLTLFVRKMKTLYSDRELTYNVHQLLHLVLCVRRWGPLWATSAFPFENYNGYIAKSVHGNKHFGREIVNNVNVARGFQVLKNRITEQKQNIGAHLELLKFKLLGTPKNKVNLTDEELQLFTLKGINSKDMQYYFRAQVNNEMFTSEFYKETKTNSYTVEMTIDDKNTMYGSIRFFFKYQDNFYMICRRLEVQNMRMMYHLQSKTVVQHIIPIEETTEFIMVKMQNINRITHLIKVQTYICKTPNSIKRTW